MAQANEPEHYRIIELTVQNVERVRALTIRPEGDLVPLVGKNAQGKSSVLKAIELLFAGTKGQPSEVIRRGASFAQVIADLGKIVVERRWTSNENTEIWFRSKDGGTFNKPQTRLNEILGELSFDPLRFMRLPPKEQVEILRKLAGADFTQLDGQRRAAFDRRTEVTREANGLKGQLAGLVVPEGTPDAPVSVESLFEEHRRLQEQKANNDQARAAAVRAREDVDQHARAVATAKQVVDEMERRLAEAKATHVAALDRLGEARANADKLLAQTSELVDPDTSEVYRKMKGAEAVNDAVRQKKERGALEAKVEAKRAEYLKLTETINGVDAAKAKALAEAKLPVPDLSFNDSGVLLKGLPLEQASTAEQLRVSLAMAISLNPRLRVMLIRDASLLDSESMELVKEMAREHDVQVWLERVARDGESGIVIEDGEVTSVNGVPVQQQKLIEESHKTN